ADAVAREQRSTGLLCGRSRRSFPQGARHPAAHRRGTQPAAERCSSPASPSGAAGAVSFEVSTAGCDAVQASYSPGVQMAVWLAAWPAGGTGTAALDTGAETGADAVVDAESARAGSG